MYIGVDFFPFNSTESIVLGIDFINDLAEDDTVASATVTIAVAADSPVADASVATRLIGGPFYPDDTTVTFRIGNSPVAGCKYIITILATTATGAELVSDYTHLPCEMPL